MESGKHELQDSVVGNKFQPILPVRVQMKYDKWQQDMGHKKNSRKVNAILLVVIIYIKHKRCTTGQLL